MEKGSITLEEEEAHTFSEVTGLRGDVFLARCVHQGTCPLSLSFVGVTLSVHGVSIPATEWGFLV